MTNSVADPPRADDLVARLRGGAPEALEELYLRSSRALLAAAYRLVGSVADAEDVVHDVFVGLPQALHGYRDDGRFDAWLRRVTVRTALMRLRSGRRRREEPDQAGEQHAAGGGPEEDLSRREVMAALAALPDGTREVVVLKLVEGYSHAEIAGLLDISAGASRVRLTRGVALLRRQLGEMS
jgi:RNA polymerase sigma-70 factor, ECF subfamily